MTIKRVKSGKGHYYRDSETGERVPGVTTILGDGIPKPALVNWAAESTAEYAIDNWDKLTKLGPAVRLKELKGARWAVKDAASNRGTQVHALAEKLVHGERVVVPDELRGYVESYVRFLDEFDVRPVLVEKTVHSEKHNYCGTFDLIADLIDVDDPEPDPELRVRHRWLLDIKTNRSGIFGETALQLAAYRHAETWIDEDAGEALPMLEVERVGAIHVRADGYELIPVAAEAAQFRKFLYAQQIAEFTKTSGELVGAPIVSPRSSIYALAVSDV